MTGGVLYRYNADHEEAQLVVPQHERERILQELHDAPTAGHNGIKRTYQRIAARYYFTGMKKYIAEYISKYRVRNIRFQTSNLQAYCRHLCPLNGLKY